MLRKRRSWFFGLSGDKVAKLFFQSNATVSVIVLALITFTIFRDAVGFIPQNRENLSIYRRAGLEFVDLLRAQVKDYSAMSRFLSDLRLREFERLTKRAGLAPAAANARLGPLDTYADRFANAISDHETILGHMTDLVSSLKERHKVAADLSEAKQNLIDGLRGATPERAALLKREADAMEIEVIDFKAEVQPLLAMLPEVTAANATLAATLKELSTGLPRLDEPAAQRQLGKFPGFIGRYLEQTVTTAQRMQAWTPDRPVTWLESFNAFAFGRHWITASFWQDWYGIIPLFAGSLLIAMMALCLAIPLGVAAAIYVNQVAAPLEQRLIKPYIEFIAAIPSVVLG
ncbi:MAG: phosphate ABC transporter permease subunit PstC, partial [Opitutus sp.]|nr:phosphate ABC transporter permease subunit PstC [Opitutus sp.]